MKDKRYDYAYQLENAKRMAKEHNRPVRVYQVYMPSVYRVDRSPYASDPLPFWWKDDPEGWVKLMLSQCMTVVMPDGTAHEPERATGKPKKKRKRGD